MRESESELMRVFSALSERMGKGGESYCRVAVEVRKFEKKIENLPEKEHRDR